MHKFIKQSCFPVPVVFFGAALEVFFYYIHYLIQQIVTEQLAVSTRVVGIHSRISLQDQCRSQPGGSQRAPAQDTQVLLVRYSVLPGSESRLVFYSPKLMSHSPATFLVLCQTIHTELPMTKALPGSWWSLTQLLPRVMLTAHLPTYYKHQSHPTFSFCYMPGQRVH